MGDKYFADVEAYRPDHYEDGVWYVCDDNEDFDLGEDCGFEYADTQPGDELFELEDDD